MHTLHIKHHIDNHRVSQFLNKTREWLNYIDIDLQLIPLEVVYTPEDEDVAEGYFIEPDDGERGTVCVATKLPERIWLTTLGHELGHVHQYIEKCPHYEKGGYYAELHAERRAQKMMIENKLPVDPAWHRSLTSEYLAQLRESPYEPGER